MARDTRALTDEVEHFDEPTPEMKRSAQRVVCEHAFDLVDAVDLLQMLGLHQRFEPGPLLTPGRII